MLRSDADGFSYKNQIDTRIDINSEKSRYNGMGVVDGNRKRLLLRRTYNMLLARLSIDGGDDVSVRKAAHTLKVRARYTKRADDSENDADSCSFPVLCTTM